MAVVFSPREWANRLVRHLTDHGGGRVRLRVVDARVALEESFQVLLVDDITSFLDPLFMRELRAQSKAVVGVFDPVEPAGKEALLALGVEEVIACDAGAEEFIERVRSAAAGPSAATAAEGRPARRPGGFAESPETGLVTVVGGPPGGTGATEIAVELARASARMGRPGVVVDADDVVPSVAQRLHLPLYPNLLTAVEAVFHDGGDLEESITGAGGGTGVVSGLASGADWSLLRPAEAAQVAGSLAKLRANVIVNIGCRVEDVPGAGPGRYATGRALMERAGAVAGVGLGTPTGITRLLAWVADVVEIASAPIHLVVNKAPPRSFQRGEITAEITRVFQPASLHFVPFDPRVARAAWKGDFVASGDFTRAVAALAGSLFTPAPRRRLIRR